jgi:hypothetical protein
MVHTTASKRQQRFAISPSISLFTCQVWLGRTSSREAHHGLADSFVRRATNEALAEEEADNTEHNRQATAGGGGEREWCIPESLVGQVRIPMKADTHFDSYRTLIRRYRTVVGAKRRSAVSNKELSDMRQENRA